MPSGEALETYDWRPVVEDFKAENSVPRAMLPGYDIGIPYDVISRERFRQIMDQSGWPGFYQQFPQSGGFSSVSAVGFDAANERAMVYMGQSCGPLCARRQFYLLEKVNGSWRDAKLLPEIELCLVLS